MESTVTRRRFLRHVGVGAAAALLAACTPSATATPKPQPTTASGAPQAPEATAVPEPTAVPAIKEPLTLTYWVRLNPNAAATMTDYNEMAAYKETEKTTGVHIEFQHPPTGQEDEQFSLMLASGKLPDAVEWNWLYIPGGPAKAIRDGVILRLNDLIDQHSPNLKKVLDEHLDWRKQIVTDEGDIYVFPFLRGDPALLTSAGLVVRKDWLDKLELPMPTTIDDWDAMLKAFRDRDPNGNGQPDEVPLTFEGIGEIGWVHAFVGAWGMTAGFYQDGGTVKYGPIQPEFKEFLTLMASWYDEGLLDPDYVSIDGSLIDAKITGNLAGASIRSGGGGVGRYMTLMADVDPNFELLGTTSPVLRAGDKPQFSQKDFVFVGLGTAITTANKHVEETAQWLDYKYGPEGHMLFNFGIEGVSYTMVDGYPQYTDDIMHNPDGLPVNQAMAKYFLSHWNGPFVQDRRYIEQYYSLPEQRESQKNWMNATNEKLMPPVTPTQDESARFASIMNDVNTFYGEMVNKIVMGDEPLDSFDKFVQGLDQMGIKEAISIQQAALDRYNKR